MSQLSRSFRQAHKSGIYAYARVEELNLGYATVRLGSNANGPRLTNLEVLGTAIQVGQLVIADYSTGKPKVRPLSQAYQEDEVLDLADFGPEVEAKDPSGNYVLYVYGGQEQSIGSGFTPLSFSTAKFDTGALFSGGVITISDAGYYFFLAHAIVQGFPDYNSLISYYADGHIVDRDKLDAFNKANTPCYAEIVLKSSTQGVFGVGVGYSIDTMVDKPTFVEAFGYLNAKANDVITAEIRSNFGSVTSKVQTGLYPRLMGHRLNRDGILSEGESGSSGISDGEQNPPAIDDSDIELQGNSGYLHVSDTDEAYARAIAHASDIADCELLVNFTMEDIIDGGHLKFWIRGSRDWYAWDRPTRGYEVSINTSGSWNLAKVSGGSRTVLGSVGRSPSLLQHSLRFYASGTAVKAKIWLTADAEPGWQIQVTDDPGLAAGTLLVGLFRQYGEHWVTIDNVNLHVP